LNALSNGKSPSPRAKGDRSQRLTVVIPNAALRADGGHSHDTRAFRIADNKLAENTERDDRLLAQRLKDRSLIRLDLSLELTGFEIFAPVVNRMAGSGARGIQPWRVLLSAGRAGTTREYSWHIRINRSVAGENASGWAER
jgi:hypothetical protein